MTQWYCYIQDQQYGPVDEPTLRQWIHEGRVLPENMVWNPQLPDWTPARDVPGLMSGASVGGPPQHPQTPASSPSHTRYPQAGAGYQPHQAGLCLGLAIAGWVTCCFFLDIAALILASKEIQEMDAGRKDPSGRGMAKAAQIISGIHLGLQALSILGSILTGLAAA
jgi:hypothetical protein